ncbi:MAG: hypothetical protein II897_05295 [Clostridia bacterium]|nr:hypothetical protein [Clostridia bacterium]
MKRRTRFVAAVFAVIAAVMKKAVLTFLLLLSCILTACVHGTGGENTGADFTPAPSDASEKSIEDFNNRFGMRYDGLAETGDAYYYLAYSGSYLYYFDKSTGDRGVLCSKPECLHDAYDDNEECGGYALTMGKSLNLWGGRLHFVAYSKADRKYALYSVNPDGTDRKLDTLLALDEMEAYGVPERYDYHRGMLYGWNQIEKVRAGEPLVQTSILSFDPSNGQMNRIYEIESSENYAVPIVFYYQQYVYFLLEKTAEEDGELFRTIELRRWNIDTATVEEVFTEKADPDIGSRFSFWVESEDRIYLMPRSVREGTKQMLYLLSGGELSELCEFGLRGSGYLSDNAALTFWTEDGEAQIEIRSFEGELVFEGSLDLKLVKDLRSNESDRIGFSSVILNGSDLIVCFNISGHEKTVFCPVKYDIQGSQEEAILLAEYAQSK